MSDGKAPLLGFIAAVNHSLDYVPTDVELLQACRALEELTPISTEVQYKAAQCVAYYSMSEHLERSTKDHCMQILKGIMTDELLDHLIQQLQPMLLRTKNTRTTAAGRLKKDTTTKLKPQLGFGMENEHEICAWKKSGGLRSIPLFFVVLSFLKHEHISSNLWWISPGILNLLDESEDIEHVKLPAVKLLHRFLECTVDITDTAHFSFAATGLFAVYEPILVGLCHQIPPLVDARQSLLIWSTAYPALLALYRVQYGPEGPEYKVHLGQLFSELILQLALPKVSMDHLELTTMLLDYTMQMIQLLGEFSVRYLQRSIYVVGEYIIRNPFLTLFQPLLEKALEMLAKLAEVCPPERVCAHRYDFLACLLITYEKCSTEDVLPDSTLNHIYRLAQLLRAAGCDFARDRATLLERNPDFERVLDSIEA
ncbi:AaceriABL075Wp [[Ashbya] aceris (nom. inval.)]|nr:AaceriABL075Wp [[Ashbya] aceris (nom. inval.)]